jgi:hypothetical protein
MATEHQLELLNDAHQAALHAGRELVLNPSFDTARDGIRTTNVLLDRCIDCGMDPHEPDHEAWAAERIASWLVSA